MRPVLSWQGTLVVLGFVSRCYLPPSNGWRFPPGSEDQHGRASPNNLASRHPRHMVGPSGSGVVATPTACLREWSPHLLRDTVFHHTLDVAPPRVVSPVLLRREGQEHVILAVEEPRRGKV